MGRKKHYMVLLLSASGRLLQKSVDARRRTSSDIKPSLISRTVYSVLCILYCVFYTVYITHRNLDSNKITQSRPSSQISEYPRHPSLRVQEPTSCGELSLHHKDLVTVLKPTAKITIVPTSRALFRYRHQMD